MSFEIMYGGEYPNNSGKNINDSPEPRNVQEQINSNNIVLEHWNNCKFKSDKKEYTRPGCCGGRTETVVGYTCERLGILDLSPLICERCRYFEPKNETVK